MAGFLRTIAQGIGSGLNRMAVGSTGGLLKPGEPGTLERRQNIGAGLADIGYLISSRGLGGSPYSQQLAANRQAEQQALLAKQKEQQAAAIQQQRQAIINDASLQPAAKYQALAALEAGLGNLTGAKQASDIAGSFAPPEDQAEGAPVEMIGAEGAGLYQRFKSGAYKKVGDPLADWGDRFQVVGGAVLDKETNQWNLAPKQPELMEINGKPGLWSASNGATDLNGNKIEEVTSLRKPDAGIEARVLDGFIKKHDGDIVKAYEAYKKAGAGDEGSGEITPELMMTAKSIAAGDIPVDTIYGLPRKDRSPLLAALAMQGVNVTALGLDQYGQKAFERGRNSRPAARLREATVFADKTAGEVLRLNDELTAVMGGSRGQFPILNKAAIAAIRGGAYGQKAASVATQFDSLVADLIPEVATVFRGGASPTEEALKEARRMIDAAWSQGTVEDVINNVLRKNLQFRLEAMEANRSMTFSGTPVSGQAPGGVSDEEFDSLFK